MNDNADIRRSLDRLQQAIEVLNDRYRDARRERKQLRERIDELVREREITQASVESKLDAAEADRRRAADLEERLRNADAAALELADSVTALERIVADRNARIAELEKAHEELSVTRAALEHEQRERSLLAEKHLQAIGKLDAATRAEAMARTESAAAEEQSRQLEETVASLRMAQAELESKLVSSAAGGTTNNDSAVVAVLEKDLREITERFVALEKEHGVGVAALKEQIGVLELEREQLQHRASEMGQAAQAAQAVAEGLREQLAFAGDSDDERVKALQAQLAEARSAQAALSARAEALEREAADASREVETLRVRLSGLEDEVKHLKASAVGNGMPSLFVDEERELLAQQIDAVIGLIDRQLAANP